MKVYRVEFEAGEEKGVSYYVNLKDYNLGGIQTYEANKINLQTGEVILKSVYLVKKTIKNIKTVDLDLSKKEKKTDYPMYLCDRCLRELRDRGELIFAGEAIHQDSLDINGIECNWCEHITDVIYECK